MKTLVKYVTHISDFNSYHAWCAVTPQSAHVCLYLGTVKPKTLESLGPMVHPCTGLNMGTKEKGGDSGLDLFPECKLRMIGPTEIPRMRSARAWLL